MYQGNGHIWQGRFNCISDFMHRYKPEGTIKGGRPSQEYRSERRNTARLSYRMAKKAMKAGLVQNAQMLCLFGTIEPLPNRSTAFQDK